VKFLRHGKRIVAADGYQRFYLVFLKGSHATVEAIRVLRRIGPRGAKDCATPRENAAHRFKIERHAFIFNQATPTFQEAYKFVAVCENALADDSANDCVQSRAITTAS
jgi:hypothetical protein